MCTDGGTRVSEGETTAGWGAVARSPSGTTEAHLACAEARLHSNNTAELSSIIEALPWTQWPCRPRFTSLYHLRLQARGQHFLGTIQARANVPLGLTLQAQSRLRITRQHICIKRRRSKDEISILLDSLLGTQFFQTIPLLQSDPGTLRRDLS